MKENLGAKIATIIAIILSFIVLGFLCVYPRVSTQEMSAYMIGELQQAKKALDENDRDKAYDHIINAHLRLEENSDELMVFYDHSEIADLHTQLAVALAIAYNGTQSEIMASIEAAISSVEYIDGIEEFGLKELF